MFSLLQSKTTYQRVEQSDSPSLDMSISAHEGNEHILSQHSRRGTIAVCLVWVVSVVASFLLGCMFTKDYLVVARRQESDLAWTHAKGLSDRHWHRFDGSFNTSNVFMGPPSNELDTAWNEFTTGRWIDGTSVVLSATEEEMSASENAASPNTVAQLGEENGGGAMATLEMFHQLHCLNLLRKWTHVDYYKTRDIVWTMTNGRENVLRVHTDHCIDILRQVLMCNGDMGLVMFHWVRDHGPSPFPDFSTVHQCRDPVAILEVARKHAAPIVKYVTKTAVAHELPTFP